MVTAVPARAEVTAEVSGEDNVKQLKYLSGNFRSDTFTIPSDEMMLAGLRATRGDDVYREDGDTAALEARVAKLAGKEAGLFLVSGTMSNQLAIRAHLTQPPHSVLLDHRAHVHCNEAGGIAVFSQATSHPITPSNGHHVTLSEIQDHITLSTDIHCAPTKLVSLENTLNGTIFPQDEIVKISKFANENGVPVHCDGARMWEVVAARLGDIGSGPVDDEMLGSVLTEVCAPFKTVSLCLSKGLGAPIGSVLVGPRDVITRCTWLRKMMGGGIRQSGAIAAAASIAISTNFPKLYHTHLLAKYLNDAIASLGFQILFPCETNMVWFSPGSLNLPPDVLKAAAAARGVSISGSRAVMRLIVHHQISRESVDTLIDVLRVLKEEYAVEGKGEVVEKATAFAY